MADRGCFNGRPQSAMQHHSHSNKSNDRQHGSYFCLTLCQREQYKEAIEREFLKSKIGMFQRLFKALKLEESTVRPCAGNSSPVLIYTSYPP